MLLLSWGLLSLLVLGLPSLLLACAPPYKNAQMNAHMNHATLL